MVRESPTTIRLSEEVREALKLAAQAEKRSVTNYIEVVLESHLRETGYLKPPRKAR